MNDNGKYLYGIVFRISNLPDRAAIEALGLEMVSASDFSAITATTEMIDYNLIPQNEIIGKLLLHQRIIEAVMALGHTIIPLKLGTFARNPAEINLILEKSSGLLRQVMTKIDGKIEINLLATWRDFLGVVKKIGETGEIRQFKEALLAGPGPITPQDQQRVGMLIKQELLRRNWSYAQLIQDYTAPACSEFKTHEIINDQIVFNTSFLLDKAKEAVLEAKLKELNARCDDELNFKYVGPLPCYSFYSLDVNRISFEMVDQARKTLGLADCATRDEIKKQYKEKAAAAHPDRHPGEFGREKEFHKIVTAYKLINNYCAAAEPAADQRHYSFQERDVNGNTIYVKLRE